MDIIKLEDEEAGGVDNEPMEDKEPGGDDEEPGGDDEELGGGDEESGIATASADSERLNSGS